MTRAPQIGDVIDDRFRLSSVLGQGGFGVVYGGEQLSSGQRVAIKVLRPEAWLNGHAESVARFERELRLIAQLEHPSIVRLIDSGVLADGQLYAALEFIDGEPLSDVIARRGPLPLALAARLMTQVLEALAHAHARGVIHRDLKPANIMVTDLEGRANARVLDFGIAAVIEDASAPRERSLTATGQLFGTPAFMAPEQLGDGTRSPQLDLYAWGLVFIEALSGRPAVQGASVAELIYQQMSDTPIEIPDALARSPLGPLIARAVEKDPSRRAPSAEALLSLLDALPSLSTAPLSSALTAERPPRGPTRPMETPQPESRARRAPWPWLLALALGVALVVVITRAPSSSRPSPPASPALLSSTETAPSSEEPACPTGQQITADTAGQCCWPGQVWNRRRCVGEPSRCPEGMYIDALAQRCTRDACESGKVLAQDQTHCCWPGQGWSSTSARCVGVPECALAGRVLDPRSGHCLLPPSVEAEPGQFDRLMDAALRALSEPIAITASVAPEESTSRDPQPRKTRPVSHVVQRTDPSPEHHAATTETPETPPPDASDPQPERADPPSTTPRVEPAQAEPAPTGLVALEDVHGEIGAAIHKLPITQPERRIAKHSPEAFRGRVKALIDSGQKHEALALSREALGHHPQNIALRLLFARALELNGHECEAVAQYQRVSREHPGIANEAIASRVATLDPTRECGAP